jgi:nitrogenase-stabilizing/protective protein
MKGAAMETLDLQDALEELSSAEEFLDYFGIPYDPAVVQVNRLHVLQRFHDYIEREPAAARQALTFDDYAKLLERAYRDFVTSDALTEKVFKVFRLHEPKTVIVPLSELRRASP